MALLLLPHSLNSLLPMATAPLTLLFLLLLYSPQPSAGQFLVEIVRSTFTKGFHLNNRQTSVRSWNAPHCGHRVVARCDATGANFGEDVVAFSFGISANGCALQTQPSMACSDVEKPQLNSTTQCVVDFAVVPRGNCSFSEKAYYVQMARPSRYEALIVYNAKGQSPIPMSGSKYAELVQIPVVMVKYDCMQAMLGHFSAEHGCLLSAVNLRSPRKIL